MKIIIGYPPLKSSKGIPLLGQNRQFQWAHSSWTAYPMVLASAATLLKKAGCQIIWFDGISEGWSLEKWMTEVRKQKPDLIILETKTPVIKQHWQIINKLKIMPTKESSMLGKTGKNLKLKIVLVGDHVTALPEESFKNSQVDYILTGGDYDFLLLNLVNHLTKGKKLEAGIFYRSKVEGRRSKVINTGKFRLNHNLDKLPFIDRELTKWRLYAFNNSNYLKTPGTYTMFGRDCWWGKCSFCSWGANLYPGKYCRTISAEKTLSEIGELIQKYHIKEIMDDSGTFPAGKWLRDFCQGMIKRGYHKKIKIDCNMRFNSGLNLKDFMLMKKAGFRLLLFGLESINQQTLNKINKNLKSEQIQKTLEFVRKAGLYSHITIMLGYPWETKKDIYNTLTSTKNLFSSGLVDSLQATMVIPYPGTPLFKEAYEKKWLKTLDWSRYDMKESILKTELSEYELRNMVKKFYNSIFTPRFIIKKSIEALTDFDTFKYYIRLSLKFPSKLIDFKNTI